MSQDGYNFINTGGSVVYQNTYDFVCHTSKGSSTYKTSYEKVARVTYNKLTNEVYMSIGDAIDQEDNYDKFVSEKKPGLHPVRLYGISVRLRQQRGGRRYGE